MARAQLAGGGWPRLLHTVDHKEGKLAPCGRVHSAGPGPRSGHRLARDGAPVAATRMRLVCTEAYQGLSRQDRVLTFVYCVFVRVLGQVCIVCSCRPAHRYWVCNKGQQFWCRNQGGQAATKDSRRRTAAWCALHMAIARFHVVGCHAYNACCSFCLRRIGPRHIQYFASAESHTTGGF